jgi:hypothetical protein
MYESFIVEAPGCTNLYSGGQQIQFFKVGKKLEPKQDKILKWIKKAREINFSMFHFNIYYFSFLNLKR